MKRDNQPLTASDIMTTDVVAFRGDTEVVDAVQQLLDRGYSGAPVVDDAGRLIGMFTERDCLFFLAARAYHEEPRGTVQNCMQRKVFAVTPDTDMFRLTYLMHDKPYRRIPVIDDDAKLVGLVARRDVMRTLDEIGDARDRTMQRNPSTYEAIAEHREHPADSD